MIHSLRLALQSADRADQMAGSFGQQVVDDLIFTPFQAVVQIQKNEHAASSPRKSRPFQATGRSGVKGR